ncbi:MAG: hydrogenase maturation nickel metallochaperone HypA [Candidatus Hydrothermae bacterium]|nr:hydrogenase maturation nickel metallochaperone HypA [Candidatus Hydrothermae bacterium]
MHELSILQALVRSLEDVARAHGATRVVRFRLEIGELANVVPELLEQAFDVLKAQEPLIEHAEMRYTFLPVHIYCEMCGETYCWERRAVRCPKCGRAQVQVVQGEELRLRDVELELPEEHHETHAC